MKPMTFLAGAILLAASTHAMADPFNGFYVGAGPQWLDVHFKSSVNSAGTTVSMPNTSVTGISGNILMGLSQHIGKSFYLAEELAYTTDSKSMSIQQDVGEGASTFDNTAYLSQQLNLGVKLGTFVSANDVIYLRPAVAYARIKPTIASIASGNTFVLPNNKPSVWGAEFGVGYDHAFTQHFIGQAEVDYTRYQSTDVDASSPDGAAVLNNYKIYSYTVGLSGIYKF